MGSIFPSLPDELGLVCLLRVDLNSHHNVRCVSKSWNTALKSPQFYLERKRLKISEQRICIFHTIHHNCNRVTIYDPEKNSCKTLPPIPAETGEFFCCHFYFVKQKLVLIRDFVHNFEGSRTWLYDFSCCKWRKGSSMPRRVFGFVSGVDEQGGLIYVGGGIRNDMHHKPVRSVLVYNVEEDTWHTLRDMNNCSYSYKGVFADGKFYPSTESWETTENTLNNWGNLLNSWDHLEYRRNKLHVVGHTENIKFSLVIGHKIFVHKWNRNEVDESFYLLEPPSERGGAIKWTRLERPSGLRGIVIGAVTLDL